MIETNLFSNDWKTLRCNTETLINTQKAYRGRGALPTFKRHRFTFNSKMFVWQSEKKVCLLPQITQRP